MYKLEIIVEDNSESALLTTLGVLPPRKRGVVNKALVFARVILVVNFAFWIDHYFSSFLLLLD